MFTRVFVLATALPTLALPAVADHPVRFTVRPLTVDANEGCDIADFDRDGKLDVVAGRNWYRNGDWLPRPVRSIDDWNNYVRSNGDWAYDVNGDGAPDVVSMDFTGGEVYWYENPGDVGLQRGHLWPPHLLVDTQQKTNETCYLVDVTNDGQPEWLSNQWVAKNPTIIWKFQTAEQEVEVTERAKTKKVKLMMPVLEGFAIGEVNGHGIGFGDINNDGRKDILFGLGWYECPAGDPLATTWTYHADWEIKHASCPMLVFDVDGDAVNDLVWSVGHGYGIFLWRGKGPDQNGKLTFEETKIDDSFSQAHCLTLADLDGDGHDELITGKRMWAHNGNDPGSGEPPIMRYYVWNTKTKAYEGYTINEGMVGGGLQIRTADLDADGDIDIVAAGKEGTQILFNQRK